MIITPKSKLMQVLDAFPELEEILISSIPVFKELNNPILRKTIAKIATMQQVATIGHIKVEDLINMLRKLVGQDCIESSEDFLIKKEAPEWFNENEIAKSFDARDMLERGEHPVNQVISDLGKVGAGKIYEALFSFLPAPLIEKGTSLNFDHYVVSESEGLVKVYFFKL
ncbi:MAG: DUF1858 domain-containing protein [Candidatus Marinimicrobia bacterium]|nr:DUF1858 domain-containing protein [Candidatus Neomarinimicrobiota bacterium]